MIEFGKITGEVDGNFIQVTLRTGESLFAPMAVVGVGTPLPSEEWVLSNKDNFLAIISYEKDILKNPVLIGFYPVKGADSSSYNTLERLLASVIKLMEQLIKAKVNTMLGAQPFMPDSIKVFNDIKSELEDTKKLILNVKLQ